MLKISKNKNVRKSYPNYRKKNDSSKEPPICYECKGRGIIENCDNRKNKKYKPKGKAMAVNWDEDSEELEQATQSSEEDISQEIKAFMAYGSPLSTSSDQDDSSSEGEGEEGNEDIQSAFNSLYLQSVEMENKNKQLRKEFKEMVQKFNSWEDIIPYLQQKFPIESGKIKELSIENSSLHKAKEELNLKITSLEKKLSEAKTF